MTKIDCSGQALVELALVLLLLLFLVLGIFEFGRAMYIKNTLTHSARAGAREAIVTPNLPPNTSDTGCTSTDKVFQTTCENLYSGIEKDNVTILVQVFSPNTTSPKATIAAPGDRVKVTVTLSNYTPVVPKFIPVPTTLAGDTAMRYE
ncbi:MAG: TadE/TadG family type IV pilus assembly protein [Geobacteraceae bacterium]|nr:TadE/TadG family type IV pilus assembly protein [Geobacteraceae bacterium]